MRNNPKSRVSEDSELSISVPGARKANINEGYNAESVVDVTAIKTSSVNRKDDGKVLKQLKAYSENNKEASLGRTRVNYDGSMDTRF